MKPIKIIKCMLVVILFVRCTSSPTKAQNYSLTPSEKHLCDSLQFDPSVIQNIRLFNPNLIEPFHYSLSKIYGEF